MRNETETGEQQPLLGEPENDGFADEAVARLGAAPWWVISGAFHALLLLFVTLIGMAVVRQIEKPRELFTEIITPDPEPPPPPVRPPAIHDTPIIDPEEPPVQHVVMITQDRPLADVPQDEEDGEEDSQLGKETGVSDLDFTGTQFTPTLAPGPGGSSRWGTRTPGNRRRMMRRYGGGGTESVVARGLAWLARVQKPDGHWDTQAFGASVKTDTACTGFALLAFLGAGHTEKVGKHKDTVRRAVAWLKSKQDANGLVFDTTDAGGHRGKGYPHAIAGMALAEAAGMGRYPDTVRAAQRAADYSFKTHQQKAGDYEKLGFRYQAGQAGDLSVTGWYVMQLKAAMTSGLHVDQTSIDGILRFLNQVEKKAADKGNGYEAPSVYWYQPNNQHAHTAHRLTAMGTLCRQFLGARKEKLESSVRWFVDKGGLPNAWGEGQTDLYYWYYGTFCTFQQGGDTWNRWNEAMKRTFIDNQRRDGPEDGSWDPVGSYSKEWGRVGQTALSVLCLEVYYRYLRMYGK